VTVPPAKAITHFARAIGAARTGNFAAAQADIHRLKEFSASLAKAGDAYWSGRWKCRFSPHRLGSRTAAATAVQGGSFLKGGAFPAVDGWYATPRSSSGRR
jgi:hypothetical protein